MGSAILKDHKTVAELDRNSVQIKYETSHLPVVPPFMNGDPFNAQSQIRIRDLRIASCSLHEGRLLHCDTLHLDLLREGSPATTHPRHRDGRQSVHGDG